MSKFSDFFHKLIGNIKSGISTIEDDSKRIAEKAQQNIGSTGYALLQIAVMQAEVTGGPWYVKLEAAVAAATIAFAKQNLPVVINDMVHVITGIVDDMKQGADELQAGAAAAFPKQPA